MKSYPFSDIEPKWQRRWDEGNLFRCPTDAEDRFYCLVMYPYPSGDLHVGHGRNYIIGDAVTRHSMMRGHSVLSPMGWDAFGLPAENAAIDRGIHPPVWTDNNIAKMKDQFRQWGIGYDWAREFASHQPSFYRWTQWLFLKLYEHGLAYRRSAPVNWCPSCATVLANEQVVDGKCERCDAAVNTTDLEQWFFKITDYADRLLEGLDGLDDWPDRVKTMQRHWIGRSEGVEIDFKVAETGEPLPCFTTRVDTIFGVTYMVMAAEHPMLRSLVAGTDREQEVLEFADRVRAQNQFERGAADVTKEGVPTGRHVVNPVNGERVPLWVANYVLMEYGTGAVMAVPAHDQRDFEFAGEYGLPVRVVIDSPDGSVSASDSLEAAYVDDGVQVNSGEFDGMPNRDAIEKIADWIEERGIGRRSVSYRLRDWLVSRQRYWGTPIPVVYCDRCGVQPVPEEELPVLLPTDVTFSGKGESPLTTSDAFLSAECPKCGGEARRETDTLDTFVDSSWYLFRYISPHEESAPFVTADVDRWFPVDLYIGGIEHACGHLIFVRFMTKVLYDLGLLGFEEPIGTLFSQGMITLNGAKMSKSKGNVVPPDDLISKYGADTERLYTLFAGPPDRDAEWNDTAVEGSFRFLNRVWHMVGEWPFEAGARESLSARLSVEGLPDNVRSVHRKTHQTIRKVSADMADMHFNTAVASLMELSNAVRAFIDDLAGEPSDDERAAISEALESMVLLMAPMVPHFAEELWERAGSHESIFHAEWPGYDENAAREDFVTIAVQIGGKLRGEVSAARGASEDDVLALAKDNEKVARHLEGKALKRVIYVQDRLLNLVV